jgi:predicted O-methyltransferase YrrM
MTTLATTRPAAPAALSALSADDLTALRQRAAHHRDAIYASASILDETGAPRKVLEAGLVKVSGEALRDAVRARGALRLLETGFAYAMSASWLIDAALAAWGDAGRPSDRTPTLTSIDPWQRPAWKNAGKRHLRDAGLDGFHRLFEDYSDNKLPALIAAKETFDAVFIDGDHRFEHVFIDLFYSRRLVAPGALIVVDDEWMPAVRKACAFFTNAKLARRLPTPDAPGADRFIFLERTDEGQTRPWDAFEEF